MLDWQQVIDSISHAIIVLDHQNKVYAYNHLACSFFDHTVENPIGLFIDDCVLPWVFQSDRLDNTVLNSFQLLDQSKADASFWVTIKPIFDEHQNINGRYISIEPYEKQHLDTAVEAKSNFLDIVSHELRTPLNAVTGHINMLRNTSLDSEQIDLVKSIIENGDRLGNIITQLIEYSQAEDSNYDLHPQPFNLQTLLCDIVPTYNTNIYGKPITINWSISEGNPQVLLADSIRIRQLLKYLMDNAIKFTEEGQIDVTAVVEKQEESDARLLKISVADTGIGIPTSQHSQIFKPFYQNDTSLTRQYEGLGISLAIAKKICHHMGGDLEFTSQNGTGSTFTLSVFVEETNIIPDKTPSENNLALRNKRILIIGRHVDFRRTISRDAKLAGMHPYVASSHAEAQYWLSKDSFDMICIEESLLDEAFDFLRQLKEQNKPIAFILIDQNINQAEIEFPFDSILKTPFTSSSIYEIFIRSLHVSKNHSSHQTSELKENALMANHHPLKIILVEDNMINKKVAERMLERLGYKIDHATNGQIGLDLILENDYDVVLMDIQMPIMDGITATKKIRQQNEKIKQPTIIAVTAHAREGDREKYLAVGMNAYVSKPIKMDALVEALYACQPTTPVQSSGKSNQKKKLRQHTALIS
ncbi:MAG: response regulator [Chloroflexota bacterium]